MKLKKNVVIVFLIIMFISLSFIYLYNNKDITYKNIVSDNKKYNSTYDTVNSSDFIYSSSPRCDKYNSKFSGVNNIFQDEKSNLWYVVQGCAWEFKDIIDYDINSTGNFYQKINDEFKKQVCEAERNTINIHLEDDVKNFNNLCTKFGVDKLEYTILEVTCNNFGIKTTGNYDIDSFVYGGTQACTTDINPLKEMTGILGVDATNAGRPVYLIQGCSWALKDISKNISNKCINDDLKKDICLYEKSFIESDLVNRKDFISNYNSSCIDTGVLDESERLSKPKYIKVVFSAYDSYGLSCRDGDYTLYDGTKYRVLTSANNECSYYFEKSDNDKNITLNSGELPNTSIPGGGTMYELSTGRTFNGWRRSSESNCNKFSINLTIPKYDSNLTQINYYACFNDTTGDVERTGATLFKSCLGEYDTEDNDNLINGSVDVNNRALLNSSVNSKKVYKSTNTSTASLRKTKISVGNGNDFKFDINAYCDITCTENFNYSYPTIFQTVKSGTYFELLSYPEIKSSLTCKETFKYDNWKSDYEEAIKFEKKAYANKVNDSNVDGLTWSTPTECCVPCLLGCCAGEQSTSSTITTLSYNEESNTFLESTTKLDTGCVKNVSSVQNSKVATLRESLGISNTIDYVSLYNNSVDERKNFQKANKVCFNSLYQKANEDSFVDQNTSLNTEDFYEVSEAKINFYYESDYADNLKTIKGVNYYKEELSSTNTYTEDTGVHYYNDTNKNFDVKSDTFFIQYGSVSDSFSSKKPDTLYRTVKKSYIFNRNNAHPEYFSNYHTGIITTGSGDIRLGYVYPIKLTLSGSRYVYFDIDANTNLDFGASNILNDNMDKNLYECSYDISNDIIVKEKDSNDYKKNFYVRSVSTLDVDPNDRIINGTFGANWANEKGISLINIIEEKAKGKNTYNPNNLEYSFTLNAGTIEAIRDYNKTNRYDDFKLTCKNMSGECESEFLNELSGKNSSNITRVNSIQVSGVNPIIKRESWKYYINGEWMKTKSITNNTSNWVSLLDNKEKSSTDFLKVNGYNCLNTDHKAVYDCVYRYINKGVLP